MDSFINLVYTRACWLDEVLVWRSPDNGWKCWCRGVQIMAGSVSVEESRQWLEVLVWRSPDNGWKC